MQLGVTFPQTEIGQDPAVLRDYAQAAEELGYTHMVVYDHVLGFQPGEHRPGWNGPYNWQSTMHEPFVLFGHLGAVTRTLEFMTGILILPQRQTALVAKQAAEVSVLTGGRLRLGVGIGWNDVEYTALNENFHNRGRRIEEQIEVMRRLWSEEAVTFQGRWHTLDHVGILPRPEKPVPVWMGGMSDVVMMRAARLAEGWFPMFRATGPDPKETLDRFYSYVREAGRDPSDVGIQTSTSMAGTPDEWSRRLADLESYGVDYVTLNTMSFGLEGPRSHIDAIRRFREETRS